MKGTCHKSILFLIFSFWRLNAWIIWHVETVSRGKKTLVILNVNLIKLRSNLLEEFLIWVNHLEQQDSGYHSNSLIQCIILLCPSNVTDNGFNYSQELVFTCKWWLVNVSISCSSTLLNKHLTIASFSNDWLKSYIHFL